MLRKLTIALIASVALGVAAQSALAQTRQIVIEPQAPVASLGAQKADQATAATPDVAPKAADTDVVPAVTPNAAPKTAEKAPPPAEEPAPPKFAHPPVYTPSYGNYGYHSGNYGYRNHDNYGSYGYNGYRSYGHRGGGC